MRTYKIPKQNAHDEIKTVMTRLKSTYRINTEIVPMSGLELPGNRKEDEWPREIPVIIFRNGSIYTICAYNDSLQTAKPMLKAILDANEQAEFDSLFKAIEYQKALNFLTENTF